MTDNGSSETSGSGSQTNRNSDAPLNVLSTRFESPEAFVYPLNSWDSFLSHNSTVLWFENDLVSAKEKEADLDSQKEANGAACASGNESSEGKCVDNGIAQNDIYSIPNCSPQNFPHLHQPAHLLSSLQDLDCLEDRGNCIWLKYGINFFPPLEANDAAQLGSSSSLTGLIRVAAAFQRSFRIQQVERWGGELAKLWLAWTAKFPDRKIGINLYYSPPANTGRRKTASLGELKNVEEFVAKGSAPDSEKNLNDELKDSDSGSSTSDSSASPRNPEMFLLNSISDFVGVDLNTLAESYLGNPKDLDSRFKSWLKWWQTANPVRSFWKAIKKTIPGMNGYRPPPRDMPLNFGAPGNFAGQAGMNTMGPNMMNRGQPTRTSEVQERLISEREASQWVNGAKKGGSGNGGDTGSGGATGLNGLKILDENGQELSGFKAVGPDGSPLDLEGVIANVMAGMQANAQGYGAGMKGAPMKGVPTRDARMKGVPSIESNTARLEGRTTSSDDNKASVDDLRGVELPLKSDFKSSGESDNQNPKGNVKNEEDICSSAYNSNSDGTDGQRRAKRLRGGKFGSLVTELEAEGAGEGTESAESESDSTPAGRTRGALSKHSDVMDEFIIQIAGEKWWAIDEVGSGRNSNSDVENDMTETTTLRPFALKAGSALFVPKCTPHETFMSSTSSTANASDSSSQVPDLFSFAKFHEPDFRFTEIGSTVTNTGTDGNTNSFKASEELDSLAALLQSPGFGSLHLAIGIEDAPPGPPPYAYLARPPETISSERYIDPEEAFYEWLKRAAFIGGMTLKALFVIAVGLFLLSKFVAFDEDPGGRGSTAASRRAKRLRQEREKARALGEGRIVRDEDDEDGEGRKGEEKESDKESNRESGNFKAGKTENSGTEKSSRKEGNATNANATDGDNDIDSDEDDEAKARNKANEANAKLAELLLANAVRADKSAAERKKHNPKPATVTRSSAPPKTQDDFANLMAADGLDDDAILEGIPKLSAHEAKSLLKYMTGNLEKLTSQVERKMGG